eukprot:1678753-Rhodomonas_salina.5
MAVSSGNTNITSGDLFVLLESGLVSRVWPRERVLMGQQACKHLRLALHEAAEEVLFWVAHTEGNACDAMCVSTALLKKSHCSVHLVCHLDSSFSAVVDGLSLAVRQGLGSALVHLDIAGVGSEVKQLGGILQRCTELTDLNISSCEMWDFESGAVEMLLLSYGLQECRMLTRLNLSGTDLGPHGAAIFADSIRGFAGLQHLDVSRNFIEDEGACALAAAVQHCTALTSLDISRNLLGGSGIDAFAGTLGHCPRLAHLNVCRNNLAASAGLALHPLAHLVGNCRALTQLDLNESYLSDTEAHALAGVLSHCSALHALDLSRNLLLSGPALASLLNGCSALTRLDLSCCGLDDAGAEDVAAVLEDCV